MCDCTEYKKTTLCDAYYNDGNKTVMKCGKLNHAETFFTCKSCIKDIKVNFSHVKEKLVNHILSKDSDEWREHLTKLKSKQPLFFNSVSKEANHVEYIIGRNEAFSCVEDTYFRLQNIYEKISRKWGNYRFPEIQNTYDLRV